MTLKEWIWACTEPGFGGEKRKLRIKVWPPCRGTKSRGIALRRSCKWFWNIVRISVRIQRSSLGLDCPGFSINNTHTLWTSLHRDKSFHQITSSFLPKKTKKTLCQSEHNEQTINRRQEYRRRTSFFLSQFCSQHNKMKFFTIFIFYIKCYMNTETVTCTIKGKCHDMLYIIIIIILKNLIN